MSIALINCIEHTEGFSLEKEACVLYETMKNNSPKWWSTVQKYALQPTNNDVSEYYKNIYREYGVEFIKEELIDSSKGGINFLNMNVTYDYFSKNIDTDYMVWMDCDVAALGELQGVFKETDKIVIADYKIKDELWFQNDFAMDVMYQRFIKGYMSKEYNIPEITHYANSWFAYGPTKHPFWSEWKKVSEEVLNIIYTRDYVMDDKYYEVLALMLDGFDMNIQLDHRNLDMLAGEIAISILRTLKPGYFKNLSIFFGDKISYREDENYEDGRLDINPNSLLYHYDHMKFIHEDLNMVSPNQKKSVIDALVKHNGLKEVMKKCDVTLKEVWDNEFTD